MSFQIIYYGYGMSPMIEYLPEETSEEEAIEIAKRYKADPHKGFSSLVCVRTVNLV